MTYLKISCNVVTIPYCHISMDRVIMDMTTHDSRINRYDFIQYIDIIINLIQKREPTYVSQNSSHFVSLR